MALAFFTGVAVAQEKRVLALAFEDHSGFDSPHGCGCLPLGPLGKIFGRSRGQREYWDLNVGFRDMLVSTLDEAYGYEAITPEEAAEAMTQLDISDGDLRKDPNERRRLAEYLNATATVSGVIKLFKQERARGVYRKDVSGQASGGSGAIGATVQAASGLGITGAYYVAGIKVDFAVYGRTGSEIMSRVVSRRRQHSLAGVRSGPIEATMSDAGPSAYIGSQALLPPTADAPIVNPGTLNAVAFGRPGWDAPDQRGRPPNYRRTLLGKVTQDVMNELIADVRERIGPPLPDEDDDRAVEVVVGKVAYIAADTGEVFINVGTQARVLAGDLFRVLREGAEITDPDTGERLGATEEAVGVVEVVEAMRAKLSRARLVEGEAAPGDVVRSTVEEPDDSADGSADGGADDPE